MADEQGDNHLTEPMYELELPAPQLTSTDGRGPVLIPALEGGGRLPANEILHADATVRSLLLEGQFERIQSLLDSGNETGTFAFNRDLLRLVRAGKISKADALRFSPNPQQLDMNMKGIFIKV